MVHEGNTNVIALKMHVWLILLIVVYPEVLWARRRHLNMHGEDMHMQAPFVPFETVLLPNNRSIGSYKSAKVSSISYTLPDSIRITASITTGSIGDVENPILLLGGQSTDQMDSGCGSWYLWSRNSNVNFGIMCYGPPMMITSGSVLKPNKNYVIVATYNKTHATLDINDYVFGPFEKSFGVTKTGDHYKIGGKYYWSSETAFNFGEIHYIKIENYTVFLENKDRSKDWCEVLSTSGVHNVKSNCGLPYGRCLAANNANHMSSICVVNSTLVLVGIANATTGILPKIYRANLNDKYRLFQIVGKDSVLTLRKKKEKSRKQYF